MKKSLFKDAGSRTKLISVLTAAGIILLLLINLAFTYLAGNKMLFLDMTPEGLYSLSPTMKEVSDELLSAVEESEGEDIRITFCSDPDVLISSVSTRVVYYMALSMANRYDNVQIDTVNSTYNPTALAMYKTTSRTEIAPDDVIISYGAKYRILNASAFWTNNGDEYFSFNGEYKLASIIASLTAISHPKAYFLTDHGESYYDPASPDSEMSIRNAYLADLVADVGLEIRLLELSKVDAIPEDCAILFINLPTEDFVPDDSQYDSIDYVSDLEKLDRYLVDKKGSVVVNKDYSVSLPRFERFLADWGIACSNSYVIDEENFIGNSSTLISEYDKSEESFGYNFYGDLATLSSSPRMIFKNTGYVYCSYGDGTARQEVGYTNITRNYAEFIGTYQSAAAYTAENMIESEAGNKALAAVSVRTYTDSTTTEVDYSYLFVTASPDFYSAELLGNPSFANYDIMLSLLRNISRTDRYVTSDLGGLSLNSSSYGGKQLVTTDLSEESTVVMSPDAKTIIKHNKGFTDTPKVVFTCIVMTVPVCALAVGVVVFIKRKFL